MKRGTKSESRAGWTQPEHLGDAVPGRLLAAGGLAALVIAWITLTSIIASWDACENLGATRAGLLVLGFPLLAAGFWLLFDLWIALSRARSSLGRFLVGILLMSLTAYLLTWIAPQINAACA
jgi:hypothetical protein